MSQESEQYEYIRATITEGELSLRYQIKGIPTVGRMTHDEDVSDYSDFDIVELVTNLLDVPPEQEKIIEIDWA